MTHQEIRPETFHDSDTFYSAVIRVTTREELTKALRERTAQIIIIEDNKLARLFAMALWVQGLWLVGDKVADVVKYAISQSYGVNFDWHIDRVSGRITLTPPTKPAPPPSRGEE
jgi:hypothetical protein